MLPHQIIIPFNYIHELELLIFYPDFFCLLLSSSPSPALSPLSARFLFPRMTWDFLSFIIQISRSWWRLTKSCCPKFFLLHLKQVCHRMKKHLHQRLKKIRRKGKIAHFPPFMNYNSYCSLAATIRIPLFPSQRVYYRWVWPVLYAKDCQARK